MIFLTSFLNSIRSLTLLLLLLSGCAMHQPGPPPLQVDALQVSLHGPAIEKSAWLGWSVTVSGAQGEVSYELRSQKLGVASVVSSGSSASGKWTPNKAGRYRLQVVVADRMGRSAKSDWSKEYLFTPALTKQSLIAVLPIENLSDSRAPMDELYQRLRETLTVNGFQLLDQADLENFMRYQRMRHVGGVNTQLGKLFNSQTGVDGVLLTSLETWQESKAPRISLIMRLVTSGDTPEIVWIDSVGLAGDESPGLLGLGRIKDYRQLLDSAYRQLLGSLNDYLSGKAPEYRHAAEPVHRLVLNRTGETSDGALEFRHKQFLPQFSYRDANYDPAGQYRVAVIPFLNINARKHAGTIVALHIVKQLHRYANIQVYEPGMVRETLLRYRMIMQSGPSLAASDVLSNEKILGADLVFSGKVFDYQGDVGESKVDFSLQAFDGNRREVVWTSRSYASGNDGVYFYNLGKTPTAHGLASRLTQSVIKQFEE